MLLIAPYKALFLSFYEGISRGFPLLPFYRVKLMRELLAPLVPLLLLVFIVSIPHFSRRATWPDHYLFKGVPVCLLDSRNGEWRVPGKAPPSLV